MGGQPSALGADGILDDLDHKFLTLAHQIGDGQRPLAISQKTIFRLGFGANVGYMQERSPFQSDIHERRFHAWQHSTDSALVNIADQAALAGPLDQDFL